jgi:hypothetical protein
MNTPTPDPVPLTLRVELTCTTHERIALIELGKYLAREGDQPVGHVSDQGAIDRAVTFLVGAGVWEAWRKFGLEPADALHDWEIDTSK